MALVRVETCAMRAAQERAVPLPLLEEVRRVGEGLRRRGGEVFGTFVAVASNHTAHRFVAPVGAPVEIDDHVAGAAFGGRAAEEDATVQSCLKRGRRRLAAYFPRFFDIATDSITISAWQKSW